MKSQEIYRRYKPHLSEEEKGELDGRLRKAGRLKFYNNIHPKNLSEILTLLLYNKVSTLKPRGDFQCTQHRLRSIEDAFRVARSYIPDITYKQVHDAIVSRYNHEVSSSYCCTVKKYVHSSSKPIELSKEFEIQCTK